MRPSSFILVLSLINTYLLSWLFTRTLMRLGLKAVLRLRWLLLLPPLVHLTQLLLLLLLRHGLSEVDQLVLLLILLQLLLPVVILVSLPG